MIYTKILNWGLWWGTTLLFLSFYIFGLSETAKYVQIGIVSIIGVMCLLRYGKKLNLRFTAFHSYTLLFVIFCFASYFWSISPKDTLHGSFVVGQAIFSMWIVYIYADHQTSTLPLLDSIRWVGYLLTIYLFFAYGWGHLKYIMQQSARIDSNLINSNLIGMLLAFSVVLTFYRFIFVKFSIWYLMVLPELLIISISGSRKGLGILILGIATVMGIKYIRRNLLYNLITILIVICVTIGLTYLLLSLPMFSMLKERLIGTLGLFSSNNFILEESARMRAELSYIGWRQFLDTPFLGIGIEGSSLLTYHRFGAITYLHNNYSEMLACGGLVGTTLYYLMYIVPGINLGKAIFSSDPNNRICLILLCLLASMDFTLVSYCEKGNYFFLLLFFMQSQLNTARKRGHNYDTNSQIN